MVKERENEEKRSVNPCAFETRRGVISGGCAGRDEKRRNRTQRGSFPSECSNGISQLIRRPRDVSLLSDAGNGVTRGCSSVCELTSPCNPVYFRRQDSSSVQPLDSLSPMILSVYSMEFSVERFPPLWINDFPDFRGLMDLLWCSDGGSTVLSLHYMI